MSLISEQQVKVFGFADGMLQMTCKVRGGNWTLWKSEERDKKTVESGSKVTLYLGKLFPPLAPLQSTCRSPGTVGVDFWLVQWGCFCRTVTTK